MPPMKTFPALRGTWACALLLGCVATRAAAIEAPASPVKADVVFAAPDTYTDWELSDGADWYRGSVFSALRTYIAAQADRVLPEGYILKVTFTDIDFGHRSSRRIPSSSGAPAFEFTYVVTNAAGTVVRQGTENLRFYVDFGNYRKSVETTDLSTDIIQREKPMLKSWADAKLAGLKQS
jgi:hypothetical protein